MMTWGLILVLFSGSYVNARSNLIPEHLNGIDQPRKIRHQRHLRRLVVQGPHSDESVSFLHRPCQRLDIRLLLTVDRQIDVRAVIDALDVVIAARVSEDLRPADHYLISR